MVRLRNALMVVVLATGAFGCAHGAARPDTTTPTGRSSTAPSATISRCRRMDRMIR